jgi:hypothetical protein
MRKPVGGPGKMYGFGTRPARCRDSCKLDVALRPSASSFHLDSTYLTLLVVEHLDLPDLLERRDSARHVTI